MTITYALDDAEFQQTVKFHGCYCLDIAMGFRVAKALMREMGDELRDMKQVVAQVSTATCAIDAIQFVAGCTFGKRNLYFTGTGKPVYILQNTQTENAVRAYVHYWETFDHNSLRAAKKSAKNSEETESAKQSLKALLDEKMLEILQAPEQALFRLETIKLAAPVKTGKFESAPCDCCGEHAKVELLASQGEKQICKDCLS